MLNSQFRSPTTKSRLRADAKEGGGAGEPGPPIDVLGPPINKLTLLKTAAFVLNFKLCPPLPGKRLTPPSRSTALPPALCILYRTHYWFLFESKQYIAHILAERSNLKKTFSDLVTIIFNIRVLSKT